METTIWCLEIAVCGFFTGVLFAVAVHGEELLAASRRRRRQAVQAEPPAADPR